jgi:Outer membrane protein beta-barrel domain
MYALRVLSGALFVLTASAAIAQIAPPPNYFARGTELAVVAGGATSSSTTGGMIAARAGWDITRWISVDGRGSWFDRGADAAAFSAGLSAVVNVVAKRTVTPFVGAGFGFYRASFDSATSSMSAFYRSRMTPQQAGRSRVFTDPAFSLSAGVDVITKHHWTVRPEVSTLLVRSGGAGDTVVTAGVSVGYRFEDHLVTPARTGR